MSYNYPAYKQIELFGGGVDGDLTISTNNYTGGPFTNGALTRDAFFNNLTITGSGQINTTNFKLYVKNNLDISGASGNAIITLVSNGNNATNATGATSPLAASTAGTIGGRLLVAAGANGGTGNGTAGTGITFAWNLGGFSIGSATSGKGGNSGANTGGNGGTAPGGTAVLARANALLFNQNYNGASPYNIFAGQPGAAGGGGAGDGTNAGGGGGSGGTGGGILVIQARNIIRSSSNSLGVIRAIGGNGGNGANGVGGNAGGGGGGSGGGGGFVSIIYATLSGTTATNAVQVDGGTGGNGGNGLGTGNGGYGGGGGGSGQYIIFNVLNGSILQGVNSAGSAGNANTGTAGGSGTAGIQLRVNL